MSLDPKLVSPKEGPLFAIGVAFSGLFWLALTVGTLGIGLVYALLFGVGVLMAHALFLAHIKGNGLRVSEHQLPELYARCQQAAAKLGMKETPEVYLVQSGGMLNAFATRFLSRKFILIYSSLANECTDPRQLDFVIGHEMGHHAGGHLAWNSFLIPFRLVPWLGAAYSRAREYTCDRCGFFTVGELEPSMRALAVLAGSGRFTGEVNLDAFMAQREETGNFWMATLELVSSHPFLCKRVAALQELAAPGTVKPVARNPLAYPLAPMFGMSAGGASSMALVMVAWIAIVAAIAIPNFMKFQERAKALQNQQGAPAPHDPDDADVAGVDRGLEGDEHEELRRMLEGMAAPSGADEAGAEPVEDDEE